MEQIEKELVRKDMKLKTIREYQGHNGECQVVTYITCDPNTGKEDEVADIGEMESEEGYNIK